MDITKRGDGWAECTNLKSECRARIKKISWKKRVTIVDALQRLNEERSLMRCIEWRKKKWIGYILRGEGLSRDGFEGRFEGSREREIVEGESC